MDPQIPKTILKKDAFKYAFKQQILPAWKPVLTMKSTIPIFILTGIVFLILGGVILNKSYEIVEITQNYSKVCQENANCQVTFEIGSEMKAPVFFYIELTNFYQNHRLYMQSKDINQLSGGSVDTSNCSPAVTNAQMGKTLSVNGGNLVADDVANPCGLVAKTFMDDEFVLKDPNNNTITIGFINWMRIAATPNFKKLWGRIEQTLSIGTYTMEIENKYMTAKFGGTKGIVLSTANEFGGKNFILSYLYLIFGALSLVIAIIFTIKSKYYPEEIPDLKLE